MAWTHPIGFPYKQSGRGERGPDDKEVREYMVYEDKEDGPSFDELAILIASIKSSCRLASSSPWR